MAKSKRLLVISDLHCGHISGLRKEKGFKYWDSFAGEIDKLKPFDVCLCNGDAIDGKGERSGGTEQLTTDRKQQKDMAIEILEYIDAKEYIFTYGTPYHVGKEEDWEKLIADHFDAQIHSQALFSVQDVWFHAKHKIGSSSIPHGRYTALARQHMWNLYWTDIGGSERADVFIRSHVHYCEECSSPGAKWRAITTPALQGWGSKFGQRMCEGTIDFGFLVFDVPPTGKEYDWSAYISQSLEKVTVTRF
jgi:hypothetical protein